MSTAVSLPNAAPECRPAAAPEAAPTRRQALSLAGSGPNFLVRLAFYASIFAMPFNHLYVPGTGERVGMLRIVQVLLCGAALSQPRVCLRLVPTSLLWFLGYALLRMLWGCWLSPDYYSSWWPSSWEFIEFLIPWLWMMFNVLQYPGTGRGGLWALALGCSVCALCHVAGIGVAEIVDELSYRTSVFGLNANEVGTTYALAMIALFGLWAYRPRTWRERFLPFPLIGLLAVAMAKTGSRTAILTLAVGAFVLLLGGNSIGSRTRTVVGLAVLGALLGAVLWGNPTAMERFEEINTRNLGQHNPRARMAPVLWEMFLRSPIYGSGPDNYQFELTRRAMPYLIRQQRTISSHNLALLLLVETGLAGFLVFSLGLRPALVNAWRVRQGSGGPLPLALLVPLVIGGLTISNPSHDLVFWVVIAYALAGLD